MRKAGRGARPRSVRLRRRPMRRAGRHPRAGGVRRSGPRRRHPPAFRHPGAAAARGERHRRSRGGPGQGVGAVPADLRRRRRPVLRSLHVHAGSLRAELSDPRVHRCDARVRSGLRLRAAAARRRTGRNVGRHRRCRGPVRERDRGRPDADRSIRPAVVRARRRFPDAGPGHGSAVPAEASHRAPVGKGRELRQRALRARAGPRRARQPAQHLQRRPRRRLSARVPPPDRRRRRGNRALPDDLHARAAGTREPRPRRASHRSGFDRRPRRAFGVPRRRSLAAAAHSGRQVPGGRRPAQRPDLDGAQRPRRRSKRCDGVLRGVTGREHHVRVGRAFAEQRQWHRRVGRRSVDQERQHRGAGVPRRSLRPAASSRRRTARARADHPRGGGNSGCPRLEGVVPHRRPAAGKLRRPGAGRRRRELLDAVAPADAHERRPGRRHPRPFDGEAGRDRSQRQRHGEGRHSRAPPSRRSPGLRNRWSERCADARRPGDPAALCPAQSRSGFRRGRRSRRISPCSSYGTRAGRRWTRITTGYPTCGPACSSSGWTLRIPRA